MRLLAEYRNTGVPLINMRPAVARLREVFGAHPMARAKPLAADKELVLKVQDEFSLDPALSLVVVRNGQGILAPEARSFWQAIEYSRDTGVAIRVHPMDDDREVVMDPLRQFGEPVVRSVRTEIIAELIRAGDSPEMIADLYELTPAQVDAAIRYELRKAARLDAA